MGGMKKTDAITSAKRYDVTGWYGVAVVAKLRANREQTPLPVSSQSNKSRLTRSDGKVEHRPMRSYMNEADDVKIIIKDNNKGRRNEICDNDNEMKLRFWRVGRRRNIVQMLRDRSRNGTIFTLFN